MSVMHMKRTQRLRRLTIVPRWPTTDTTRKQNVGEHSYNVAVICAWLFEHNERIYKNCQRDFLLMYALLHDEIEAITGDIAAPSKQSMVFDGHLSIGYEPDLLVKKVVKLADMCDAYLFILEEQRKGNELGPILEDVLQKLVEAWRDVFTGEEDESPFITFLEESFSMRANPGLEYREEGYR